MADVTITLTQSEATMTLHALYLYQKACDQTAVDLRPHADRRNNVNNELVDIQMKIEEAQRASNRLDIS